MEDDVGEIKKKSVDNDGSFDEDSKIFILKKGSKIARIIVLKCYHKIFNEPLTYEKK